MNEFDIKSEKTKKVVQYGLFALAAFLFGPIALVTIKGGISLIIMLILAVFTTTVLIPWLSMAAKNWRLKVLKAEAAKNPIETLENQYIERKDKILTYKQKVMAFAAEVRNFASEILGLKKEYPEEANTFDKEYESMEQVLHFRIEKYKNAQTKLEEFERSIGKFKAKWKVSLAAAKARNAAQEIDDEFIGKLMTETAMDAVTTNMNNAFAELDLALAEEEGKQAGRKKVSITSAPVDAPQLAAPAQDDTIELSITDLFPQKEKVSARR